MEELEKAAEEQVLLHMRFLVATHKAKLLLIAGDASLQN